MVNYFGIHCYSVITKRSLQEMALMEKSNSCSSITLKNAEDHGFKEEVLNFTVIFLID